MVIVMRPDATSQDVEAVMNRVREGGCQPSVTRGEERSIVSVIGDPITLRDVPFTIMPGVDRVVGISRPYKLADTAFHPERTVVSVAGGVDIGDGDLVIIAGPCAVESHEQLRAIALAVKEAGATMLRGGAFKPRTSPYSFAGLGEEGLRILRDVGEETGLPVVTEAVFPGHVRLVAEHAAMLQIGARNMQNFTLLQEVGKTRKPVLLKRGMQSKIEEWLLSAEYVLREGNKAVVLCERGIRTFETATRNTLDVSAIALMKRTTHLPVIADPSHGTGKSDLVTPMACAAAACGSDGLIVEVHTDPTHALSDAEQALTPDQFAELVEQVRAVAAAQGRSVRSAGS